LVHRRPFSTLTRERLVAHNLIVAAGTVSAGLLGVAVQSLVSHRLLPSEYGGVFAVLTLLNLVWLPGAAFTLLMARQTSRDRASGQTTPSVALLRAGNRALILFGAGIALLVALSSPFVAPLIDVPIGLLWAAAAGIPFGLALPLLLGVFQGGERFITFSAFAAGQAALKLVAAVALGVFLGPAGVVLGISLGTAITYLIALGILRKPFARKESWPWLRPAVTYLALILPSTLAVAVLLSADVLIVKHFFGPQPAGEYAVVAALGRAIFWGATAVAAVLFPKVVFRENAGQSWAQIVLWSFALAIAGGALGVAVLTRWSEFIITVFAGAAYAPGSAYLPWYALGMTLLGGAVVLIATEQSRGASAFLWVLLPMTLAEPALLVRFHESLTQVIQVLDACMAVLVIGLALVALSRRRLPASASAKGVANEKLRGETSVALGELCVVEVRSE